MNIINTNFRNAMEFIYQVVKNRENSITIRKNEEIGVWVFDKSKLNLEYCEKNNIPINDVSSFGKGDMAGCIVANKNDMSFLITHQSERKIIEFEIEFCKNFKDFLNNKGLEMSLDGNDYLIDGKKFLGYIIGRHDNINFVTMFVAIDDSTSLIKKICNNTSTKKHTNLSQYDIAANDIIKILEKSCKNLKII